MKNIFKSRSFLIPFAVCLLPFAIGAVFYGRMPEQMATHFDFNFQPDDYSSREFALLGIPAFMTAIFVLCVGMLEVDPKKRGMNDRLKTITRWIVPILSIIVQCIIISYALDDSLNLVRFIPILVGVLILLIGNYLPKCRQNYTMGIKLPWTLNSEENWERDSSVRRKNVRYSRTVHDTGGVFQRICFDDHICAFIGRMFHTGDIFIWRCIKKGI